MKVKGDSIKGSVKKKRFNNLCIILSNNTLLIEFSTEDHPNEIRNHMNFKPINCTQVKQNKMSPPLCKDSIFQMLDI